MDKEQYMQRAIDFARKKMREGRGHWPFGSLVVKDGEIVGEGCNDMGHSLDPTSHGEIVALRDACKRLGTMDLSGCDLYTSCEPCPLCFSAIWLTNISKIYYGASLNDCLQYGSDFTPLRIEVGKPMHQRDMPSERVLGDKGRALLGEWASLIKTTATMQKERSRHAPIGVRSHSASDANDSASANSSSEALDLGILKNLTDIALFVSDIERSVNFYSEKLDFELTRRDIGFAEFKTRGVSLALWEVSDAAKSLELNDSPRQGLSAMVAIQVENAGLVDAMHEKLKKKGVNIVQGPTTHAWNARTTYFSDPDENLWEIYSWTGVPRTI